MKLTPDIESAYSLCCTTYRQPCNCEKNKTDPCKMMTRKVEELKLEPKREAMVVRPYQVSVMDWVNMEQARRIAEIPHYGTSKQRGICNPSSHVFRDGICIKCGWLR